MLQGRLGAEAKLGSPYWLEPSPAKERIPSPPSTTEEPEQEVMNLLSSSSIGNLLHRHEIRPALDLVEEDLSMRLSGPSLGTSLVQVHTKSPATSSLSNAQPKGISDMEEVQESRSRGTKARKL